MYESERIQVFFSYTFAPLTRFSPKNFHFFIDFFLIVNLLFHGNLIFIFNIQICKQMPNKLTTSEIFTHLKSIPPWPSLLSNCDNVLDHSTMVLFCFSSFFVVYFWFVFLFCFVIVICSSFPLICNVIKTLFASLP